MTALTFPSCACAWKSGRKLKHEPDKSYAWKGYALNDSNVTGASKMALKDNPSAMLEQRVLWQASGHDESQKARHLSKIN